MIGKISLGLVAAFGVAALGLTPPQENVSLLVALKFDPKGTLYAADAKGDQVLAYAFEDKEAKPKAVNVATLGEQLKKALDAGADPVQVHDVAVHPVSHTVYLSASKKGAGASTLFRVNGDKIEKVEMAKPTAVALPSGARPYDLVVTSKDVVVSSMNRDKTFGSALHRIALPMKEGGVATSETEIYHTSHKKWETKAPLIAMAGFSSAGQDYVMGSTACTPVVRIGVGDVADKKKVQTQTIVELGNRNAPVSMLVYTQKNMPTLLVTNNKEGAYKVPAPVLVEKTKLNEQAINRGGGAGGIEVVDAWKGVKRTALLDAASAVAVRDDGGTLSLVTLPLP
jgi:hypothetical protein